VGVPLTRRRAPPYPGFRIALVLVAAFVIGNALVDVLYAALDPRGGRDRESGCCSPRPLAGFCAPQASLGCRFGPWVWSGVCENADECWF
jgi:hypothetical protein